MLPSSPRKRAYGPTKTLSPGLILTGTLGAMRLPPTCVPLVLPKSVIASMPSGVGATPAWRPETCG